MNNKNYSLAQLAAIYTTYKDLDKNHCVNCCTCGKTIHIQQIEDCYSLYGHFHPRSTHPQLKFHPYNAYAQCCLCNMSVSSDIDNKYKNYMQYRFGSDYDEKLFKNYEIYLDLEYTKQFYIDELIKLSTYFPELQAIFLDYKTGEVLQNINVQKIESNIESQWETFNVTYRQDLDNFTRELKTEPIEYERL